MSESKKLTTRTAPQWAQILVSCGVRPSTAAKWAEAFSAELRGAALSAGDSELDDFLGQLLHECRMLEKMEEALYYSTPGRLIEVWPTRFKSRAAESPYLRNPEALANKVYGGRLGNVAPGDGWRYRGRGLIQITGRQNYQLVGESMGLDLVGNPDLLLQAPLALRASIRWWEKNLPDSVMGNLPEVTRRVNGGATGLADRRHVTGKAQVALS